MYNKMYLPYALWSCRAAKTLYLIDSPHGASLYPPNQDFILGFKEQRFYRPVGQAQFSTVSLDFALGEAAVSNIDVLKVDTEGAELEILRGGPETLRSCFAVELEVWFNPVQEGTPLFAEVDGFMRAAGFQLFDMAKANYFHRDLRWPKGQLVAADVLYLKTHLNHSRSRIDRCLSVLLAYGLYDYGLALIASSTFLTSTEKAKRMDIVLQAGKRLRFRGATQLAVFLDRLSRRLATVDLDCLGNVTS